MATAEHQPQFPTLAGTAVTARTSAMHDPDGDRIELTPMMGFDRRRPRRACIPT
jgi:hypothetical protein